jgi:hypothetical protein
MVASLQKNIYKIGRFLKKYYFSSLFKTPPLSIKGLNTGSHLLLSFFLLTSKMGLIKWFRDLQQNATWQNAAWQNAAWQNAAWQNAAWQNAAWQNAAWQNAAWQNAA